MEVLEINPVKRTPNHDYLPTIVADENPAVPCHYGTSGRSEDSSTIMMNACGLPDQVPVPPPPGVTDLKEKGRRTKI